MLPEICYRRSSGCRLACMLLVCLMMSVGTVRADQLEPRWLIEVPTAGVLPQKQLAADIRFAGGNSVLAEFELGLWSRAILSASFGGQNLLGDLPADWNPDPGISARLRVLNETATRPAFAIGFRSQGYGRFDDSLERYERKSLGIYAVFSRNYRNPMGQGGVHFGLNRSLEDSDGDAALTGFFGSDVEFGRGVAILGEYLFAFNDDDGEALGKGRGYLNLGIRILVGSRLAVEFDLKDVLENNTRNQRPEKEVRVILLRGL